MGMIAELGLRVDSSGAKRAAVDLDKLTQTAGRTEKATSRFGRAAQNASYQVTDFVTQVSGGTSATRALSQQLPQLLAGFGALGAAAGAAAAVTAGLAGAFRDTSSEMDTLIKDMTSSEVGLGSIRGSINELIDLQGAYSQAIASSGTASGALAEAVAQNSKREFNARKEVLAVERELLRIRGMEQRQSLQNLQEAARREAEAQILRNSSGMNGGNTLDPSLRPYVYGEPRTATDVLGEAYFERNEERALAMRRLKAEIELTELAADEASTALDRVFRDVTGAGTSAVADAVGRAGGGGRSASAKALDDIAKSAERVSEHADALSKSFSSTFASIVTGADDASDALSKLAMQWASTLAQQGFDTLFDSVFGSILPNATGNAFMHGRVTTFANGGVVNGPTLFPMAKGMGLMARQDRKPSCRSREAATAS